MHSKVQESIANPQKALTANPERDLLGILRRIHSETVEGFTPRFIPNLGRGLFQITRGSHPESP